MSSIKHEGSADTLSRLRIGLIGNPVAHSYSPRFQQAALDALHIPARYELWQTLPGELPARVAALLDAQCLGANVTIPYKEAVLPLVDRVDPLATRIRAVNTIVHHEKYLYGYNTDAPGLLHALAEEGIGEQLDDGRFSLKGYSAVLLGAGGAARSAAFALAEAGVTRLVIINRNLERAEGLAADIVGAQLIAPGERQGAINCAPTAVSDPEFLIPHAQSIIINATPVGMHAAGRQDETEGASPLPAEILARFAPDTFVCDMIYNPMQTRLLCQARAMGLRAVNGLPMLLHQGALAFTLWTGQRAPLEVMRSTLL